MNFSLILPAIYRYNQLLEEDGDNPLAIDSKPPAMPFADYALNENRYRALKITNPDMFDELMGMAQKDVEKGRKTVLSPRCPFTTTWSSPDELEKTSFRLRISPLTVTLYFVDRCLPMILPVPCSLA